MSRQRAVVVFSGGQDSTTCLYWAKQRFDEVIALTFRYGQRHALEIEQARLIAEAAEVDFHLMEIPFISSLANNSLTNTAMEVDKEVGEQGVPNTFVPGRNLFFLGIAAVFAREQGIFHLVTGTSEADYSGYPDCREAFIKSMEQTLSLAMDEEFTIHTPLMFLKKSQVWQMADEMGVLDVVRTQSLTCYHGIVGDGCGECPACHLRRKGLEEYMALRSREAVGQRKTAPDV